MPFSGKDRLKPRHQREPGTVPLELNIQVSADKLAGYLGGLFNETNGRFALLFLNGLALLGNGQSDLVGNLGLGNC